ncbi:MAG: hypothetical protein LC634_04495 [Sphingomonadales bacterium]|nr:hypothetical protein [Sphingomonadales bacterium]
MAASMKYLPIGAFAALALAGCATSQDEQAHFRPAQGWSLCSAPLPIEMVGFAPAAEGMQLPVGLLSRNERTNVAGAVALAFALRCDASAAIARQAQAYRGITVVHNPGAGRVRVHPATGSAELIVDVPTYADYRSDAFLGDLRTGITCALAPGEIADPGDCLPG